MILKELDEIEPTHVFIIVKMGTFQLLEVETILEATLISCKLHDTSNGQLNRHESSQYYPLAPCGGPFQLG